MVGLYKCSTWWKRDEGVQGELQQWSEAYDLENMRDAPEVHLYRVKSMMLHIYLILLLKVAAVCIIISTVFIIANSVD